MPHAEATGGGVGEEAVGEVGLGGDVEDEGLDDVFAEGFAEARGEVEAEAGGVDADAGAVPRVPEEGDETVALLVEGAAGPPVGFDDAGDGMAGVGASPPPFALAHRPYVGLWARLNFGDEDGGGV